jgi:hypothetical protein
VTLWLIASSLEKTLNTGMILHAQLFHSHQSLGQRLLLHDIFIDLSLIKKSFSTAATLECLFFSSIYYTYLASFAIFFLLDRKMKSQMKEIVIHSQ